MSPSPRIRSWQFITAIARLIGRPSTRALASTVATSSPGLRRLAAISASQYANSSVCAAICAPDVRYPDPPNAVWVSATTWPRSLSGTPSRSQITTAGIGAATAATKSTPGSAAARDTSRRASCRVLSVSRRISFGVNAAPSTRRISAWPGPSLTSRDIPPAAALATMSVAFSPRWLPFSDDNR